uniref:SAYSvFN domain-containing protein n=1 Tax=Chromera velia CCMP2878 TaxID=1169474 RepID=A0A0G4FDE9_9ALVE|eukprot:Cvel_16475.t1-p1 / transcript=Cvel_16475.t1 / gene=Cvel_16475 / organism=Chromera_velia_CCMP2878 / gene_product=hypothetical protein / transcript_product=hypothetical protein / location=Cvel_scaffold1270:17312-19525(+) / protein_length=331 / sequence_SO=supercontig / SO=protein_coding / is_pseudo=false
MMWRSLFALSQLVALPSLGQAKGQKAFQCLRARIRGDWKHCRHDRNIRILNTETGSDEITGRIGLGSVVDGGKSKRRGEGSTNLFFQKDGRRSESMDFFSPIGRSNGHSIKNELDMLTERADPQTHLHSKMRRRSKTVLAAEEGAESKETPKSPSGLPGEMDEESMTPKERAIFEAAKEAAVAEFQTLKSQSERTGTKLKVPDYSRDFVDSSNRNLKDAFFGGETEGGFDEYFWRGVRRWSFFFMFWSLMLNMCWQNRLCPRYRDVFVYTLLPAVIFFIGFSWYMENFGPQEKRRGDRPLFDIPIFGIGSEYYEGLDAPPRDAFERKAWGK